MIDLLILSKEVVIDNFFAWLVGVFFGFLLGIFYCAITQRKIKETRYCGFIEHDYNARIGVFDNGKAFDISCPHYVFKKSTFKRHFCNKLNRKCPYF